MKRETNLRANNEGFTLIEILVVIGIIAILAAVVLVAINPAKQFAQANDSQRDSNVNTILDAINQYMADNKGDLPNEISGLTVGNPTEISSSGADLCEDLVPVYISELPTDPDSGHKGASLEEGDCDSYNTRYTVTLESGDRVTIAAPNTSQWRDEDISSTR